MKMEESLCVYMYKVTDLAEADKRARQAKGPWNVLVHEVQRPKTEANIRRKISADFWDIVL